MAQAITTKYLPRTETKPPRIKAQCQGGSTTVDYNDDLEPADNHAIAAMQLAVKLEWSGDFVGGGTPGSDGYAFVNVDRGLSFGAHFELMPRGGR